MAFFEEQITERKKSEEDAFNHALESLCIGATGNEKYRTANAIEQANSALDKILAYCGAKPAPPLKGEEDIVKLINHHLDSTGIRYRSVELAPDFYKDAIGCFLALTKDGTPVAVLPGKHSGYVYFDPHTSKPCRVGKNTIGDVFLSSAYCFYRPLPSDKLTIIDLLRYVVSVLDRKDYGIVICAILAATLVGLMVPALTRFIFGPIISSGAVEYVIPIAVMLLSITIAQICFTAIKSVALSQIKTKILMNVESAVMMRLLSLPPTFFKEYPTGEIISRFSSVSQVVDMICTAVLGSSLTSLVSLIYVFQLFAFAPKMVLPVFVAIFATCAANVIIAVLTNKRVRRQVKVGNRLNTLEFSLLSAIQKIKLCGSEKRIFSIWAELFSKQSLLSYGRPGILVLSTPISLLVASLGMVLIYYVAIDGGIALAADYMAFASIYGMITAAFTELNSSFTQIFTIKPYLEQIEPILSAVPESTEKKTRVRHIKGSISLQNIEFSYSEKSKPIYSGLNLDIKAGEHVAFVGKTGCGKSTLMRIMLGFETPSLGTVFYDGRDMSQLDPESLRQHFGVVLQDSTLVAGSIFSNIALSCPELTMDEAYRIADMVGIGDDIREMPMKMMTMVSDGGGGLSGGQRQRVMIARAMASKPKILFFDEATSALDNITQKTVIDSLNTLKCTRVVIAHRLSTIKECDTIFVFDDGKVVEQGTYDELMALDGFFANLVRRQIA